MSHHSILSDQGGVSSVLTTGAGRRDARPDHSRQTWRAPSGQGSGLSTRWLPLLGVLPIHSPTPEYKPSIIPLYFVSITRRFTDSFGVNSPPSIVNSDESSPNFRIIC